MVFLWAWQGVAFLHWRTLNMPKKDSRNTTINILGIQGCDKLSSWWGGLSSSHYISLLARQLLAYLHYTQFVKSIKGRCCFSSARPKLDFYSWTSVKFQYPHLISSFVTAHLGASQHISAKCSGAAGAQFGSLSFILKVVFFILLWLVVGDRGTIKTQKWPGKNWYAASITFPSGFAWKIKIS